MPIPAYRAKQSTDTPGPGTIVLNAAGTNARSFAAAYGASSRRIMYAISWASGFEIGYGDFDGGTPGSLARATVVASSNAGALVTLPAGTKDVFAVFDPGAREVLSISGTTTLALADMGNAVVFTGASAATLNLPAIATVPLGAGWMVVNAGTASLTIDPNGTELVSGVSTLTLPPGGTAELRRVSTAWQAARGGVTDMANARNLIINGNPVINQRVYVSGTATTGANQYTLDRWRVVTSGQSVSWTDSAGIRTVNAPAGGMEQVVEALNNLGGVHTLSWTGTATATVNGASVANGGQVTLTGGADVTLRMSNGTWAQVQLEPGTVATPFERRQHGAEMALCERYFQRLTQLFYFWNSTGRQAMPIGYPLRTRMRTTPTITNSLAGNINLWAFSTGTIDGTSAYVVITNDIAGGVQTTPTIDHNAEL